MGYVLIARWKARAGEEQKVQALLAALAREARREPGCRLFQPAVDRDDPRAFSIFEMYDDEDAFAAHESSPHFKRYVLEEGIPLLEERGRSYLRAIDVD